MKYLSVFTLVSLFVFGSCSHAPTAEELNKAEQLMTEAPDSAEKILNAIPRRNLKSRAQKARFALLYSQAMDKCYIDTDNDSLISVAVKYYSKRGSDHEKALAYYYESVVYRNAKNTDAQVESLVKAQQYAEKTTDHFLNGLIYSKQGQLYYFQFQFSEAEELFRKAVDAFDKANNIKNKMISLNNLSNALYFLNRKDEYVTVTEEALNIAKALDDNTYVVPLEYDLLTATDGWNKDEILRSKKALFANKEHFSKGEFARYLSNHYEREGNIDSTKHYLIEYIENDDVRTLFDCGAIARLSSLCENQGDFTEALKYEKMYAKAQDSLKNIERKNIVEELEQKYKTKEISIEKESLRKQQTLIIWIGILVALILISVIVWIIKSSRNALAKQREEYESYITQYDTQCRQLQEQYDMLSNKVGVYTNEQGEFGVKLIELLKNRLSSLRTLAELAYKYGEKNTQTFYNKFQEHIMLSKNKNEEFIDEILEVANVLNNGVITYLTQNYPELSKFELSYCGLVALGFTPESIRILYNHTHIHSLYTIRGRIKSKLNFKNIGEDNHSLEDYILNLCNTLNNQLT